MMLAIFHGEIYASVYRDGTGQRFCSPARPELIRNCPALPVYPKQQIIFWPGPARGPQYNLALKAK